MTGNYGFRLGYRAVQAAAIVCAVSLLVWAADAPFAGKWKGELKVSVPPTSAAPATGAAGGGGGRPGGGGVGRPGGFGGGFGGGVQKVSLNLKQSKENKVSGNIVFGDSDAYDVKDARIEGSVLTFKAGRAAQGIYDYKAELKEDQIVLTRTPTDGRGRPQEYILTKR